MTPFPAAGRQSMTTSPSPRRRQRTAVLGMAADSTFPAQKFRDQAVQSGLMKSKSTARSGKGEQRVALSLHALCTAVVCAPVAALPAHLLAQAPARPELSIKLVDPKMLRVCADPHNMPFSTERGEGFENKLAELLAAQLGKGLTYTWYPQAPGFVRNTLRAYKCGVLIGVPQGDDIVQVTNPYYHGLCARALARQRARGRGHAGRPTAEGETLRHRGRNTSGGLPRAQRAHGPCKAVPARDRYARGFLRSSDDARSHSG